MSEDVEVKQANFEGWAIVEMMGHRKEIGFVTTQAFGQAVLFRVDTPELPGREFTLTKPEYARDSVNGTSWCPAGSKVSRPAIPARTCLVAPASLYAMNPCTEEVARHAIERNIDRPLILLELPVQNAIAAPMVDDVDRVLDSISRQDDGEDDDEDEEISDAAPF